MILQALTECYRVLENIGSVPPFGWGEVKVSFVLSIGADGTLERVSFTQKEQGKGSKKELERQPKSDAKTTYARCRLLYTFCRQHRNPP